MNKTRLQIAKADIVAHFDAGPRVLKTTDIAEVLSKQRNFWRLAQRTTTDAFIRFLIQSTKLKRLDFPFPYRKETRFTWGDVPLLEVLLTLKKDAYFSHYTAMRMHGLTEQIPKTIYLNHEQRPQPRNPELEQGRIDAAFKRRPRISHNEIDFNGTRICLINGKHTGLLGVIEESVSYDSNETVNVRLTNLERTLIDITVRPAYAGGVFEVRKAFQNAKDRVSVNALAAMLQKINHVYPYHQAIGFYLESTGYRKDLYELLSRFPMEYDFYLTYEMKETEYNKKWRLYIPKGF